MASATTPPGNPTSSSPSSRSCGACASCAEPRRCNLIGMLRRRGIEARLLETPGAPPAVYGDLPSPGARRTVVVYAHYDGQPVDPAQWKSPPWTPVLLDKPLEQGGRELPFPGPGQKVPEEARLYARSASDDKAPIVAMLSALDALRAAGTRP